MMRVLESEGCGVSQVFTAKEKAKYGRRATESCIAWHIRNQVHTGHECLLKC